MLPKEKSETFVTVKKLTGLSESKDYKYLAMDNFRGYVEDDIYLSFIFLPLAYAMFSREVYIKGIDSGKPNILQYVFLVLKILTMIELIEFLFLI